MKAVVDFPGLVVLSRANRREHWAKRHHRDKAQKAEVQIRVKGPWDWLRANAGGPIGRVRVTLVRTGGSRMDDDNLAGAFKAVRDQVARIVGRDDGDERFWEWRYEQRPGPLGIRVEIEAHSVGAA